MWDIILDALLDSLKVFPFILLIYILMELIESAKNKEKIENALSGKFAPFISGTLGVIPECGYAVATAKLFDKGLIKLGTLIAAFIAVSDEGLIVLFSDGNIVDGLILTAVKVVYACGIGILINFIFSSFHSVHICPEKDDCIECGQHHDKPIDKFFLHPLFHAVKTFIFVLIFSEIFAIFIYFLGDNVESFLSKSKFLEPVVSALVGLIPNCASSTAIATAYNQGILGFSGLIAGLSSNAGLGILILFRNRKNLKINLLILAIQFVSAVVIGYLSLGVIILMG